MIGQQAPPEGGYTIERFEGYLDEMGGRVESMQESADHRAIFEITYHVFSHQVLEALKQRRFEDMEWATDIACRFIEVYRQQLELWETRDPSLCRAWSAAFEAMEEGKVNVLQGMLLGINAHINYDLPFVTLGALRHAGDLREGESIERALSASRTGVPAVRYRDFLVINQLEWEAIELIQDTVLRNYNRLLYWGNRLTLRSTRFLGQRVLMEARDIAWFGTTMLAHARDDGERALVGRLIDASADGLADLVSAFTVRPPTAFENAVMWARRGERIDPELQAGLVELALSNRVVAELVLEQLAFAGAEPVSVLVTLLSRGESRLAGLFGRAVLRTGPRRRRQRLARLLRAGSQDAVAIVDAMLASGSGSADLPRGAPVGAARRGWQERLAADLACVESPDLAGPDESRALLREAVAEDARELRKRLRKLDGAEAVRASESLGQAERAEFLMNHPDPWVRTCAGAADLAGSVSTEEREGMQSVIERVLFLKETGVFMEVDISVLIHVAEKLEFREFPAGETFVETDRPTGGIYLIQKGEVEVSQLRDGRRVGIARLGAHESVGDLSALNDTPATADCTAVTPVECWYIRSGVLANLLHEHPRLGIGLIRMLSQRLISTTLRVQQAPGEAPAPAS